MTDQDDLSLGNIAKKGLGFLNTKISEALDASEKNRFSNAAPAAPNAPEAPSVGETKHACCPNCGISVSGDAAFCHACGASVAEIMPPPQGQPIDVTPFTPGTSSTSERTQIYEGAMHKCPNCGEVIDSFDAVCDACGYRIANRNASTSTQRFYAELAALEKTRKQRKRLRNPLELDVVDKQKITLINTFPVPNTIEELSEFMFMTAENINVEKSMQRSGFSKFWSSYEGDPEKAMSDVWVAKMKQIYHKAKLSFSDDPVFSHIEELYTEKMTELNML